MPARFKNPLSAACLFASALALGACTATTSAQTVPVASTTADQAEPLVIDLQRGEVLQIIAPESRSDGNAARQAYYQAAYPIAGALGYERLGQLSIRQKVVSDYDPGGLIFFSWPDAASVQKFNDDPDWPSIKATRPEAWSELKIYTAELDRDLKLTFDPAKDYTLVVGWGNPDNPDDYERYLSGIEPAVERAGGRFIYKMRNPAFEAHASPAEAPVQLTFVEWDGPDGFAEVQRSDEYLASRQYFGTGLTRFEFYWLKRK